MLMKFNTDIRSESFTKLLALCLVIPAYMDFFVSKAPLFQFIGYLSYLIPLGILFIHQQIDLSKKFIIYWIIFSILLILPSIINLSSGRLESDLINIKGLFSKWVFLSALMIFFYFEFFSRLKMVSFLYQQFLHQFHLLLIFLLIRMK